MTAGNYAALAQVIRVAAIPPEAAESLRVASVRVMEAFGDAEKLAVPVARATEAIRRQCEAASRAFEASR